MRQMLYNYKVFWSCVFYLRHDSWDFGFTITYLECAPAPLQVLFHKWKWQECDPKYLPLRRWLSFGLFCTDDGGSKHVYQTTWCDIQVRRSSLYLPPWEPEISPVYHHLVLHAEWEELRLSALINVDIFTGTVFTKEFLFFPVLFSANIILISVCELPKTLAGRCCGVMRQSIQTAKRSRMYDVSMLEGHICSVRHG